MKTGHVSTYLLFMKTMLEKLLDFPSNMLYTYNVRGIVVKKTHAHI